MPRYARGDRDLRPSLDTFARTSSSADGGRLDISAQPRGLGGASKGAASDTLCKSHNGAPSWSEDTRGEAKGHPMNAADLTQSALPLASSDLSIFTLFWNAHWIVKAVMLGLLVASIWVWAIVIDKIVLYGRTRKAMDRFEQAFWSGQSLEELYRNLSARTNHSMPALFVAAMREWKRSLEGQARSFAGLQMRIEKVMDVSIAREIERLERRLLVLATVGSSGPFVGLFGTVWGIMTSFQSIAASKNTSLAVVAPGIAEALFATAIGLVAAIPATIFYNKFVSEVNKQAQRLEGFADEFAAILSRQIDERA
jgi:biopolymer transport protein TolQ